jgi:hypothetical protein
MRIITLPILACALAGAALAFPALTVPAQAVQDVPATLNGVETVCTGVGSAKDDPRWSAYPVKIVLANTSGANMAKAHIALSQNGKTVAETDCDAPWILLKPTAGKYTATATLIGGSGQSRSVSFTTSGSGRQQEVTIMFARTGQGQGQGLATQAAQ